ncbi:MAG: DUF885 domain-containing protein [Thermoanaerobaculia bacterium]
MLKRWSAIWLAAALLAVGPARASDPAAARAAIMERVDALAANADAQSESERLAEFLDIYFDWAMNEFPEFATYIGHAGDHGRWSDGSLEAVHRREADTERALEVFRGIDRSRLEGEDRLNYDLLLQQLEDSVAGARFDNEYLVLSQLGGVHQSVSQMAAIMPTADVEGYEDLLSRLRGVGKLVDDDIDLMRMGLEKGVTPPRVTLRDVPQQVENLLAENPLESPLLAKFTRFPASIPEAEQQRLKEEAVAAYEEVLAPAYGKLHTFLVDEYLPGSRESIAMRDLPDGEAWYAYLAQQYTTTELTPQQIHDLGLSEVKRIRAEMDRVIADSGFEGSFEDFTTFLRTDPQFYFDTPEELLTAYRDIAKRADPELIKLFGTLPRLPYGVTPVPDFMAEQQTTAYYEGGSLEAGRPGQFFANTSKLDTRPKWEMEALTLHEAVPGHHLQISLQQEIPDLAWFRRFGGYTAFVEGWGLYAESLGEEMGFYEDPYSKFGQLTYEMWRAVRLVVDTGMHSLGWSRQQAIDFFKDNSGKTEHDIVVEVDRYIVNPGQALAYKIGELKLKELRAYAEDQLGDAFDVRAFHDEVLGNGALPLSVLETHIHEWVDATREAMEKS